MNDDQTSVSISVAKSFAMQMRIEAMLKVSLDLQAKIIANQENANIEDVKRSIELAVNSQLQEISDYLRSK